MEAFKVNPNASVPKPSGFTTLYFGKGKKDKLNKVDIVGFLGQKGGLQKDEIGLIEVKDYFSYAAIKSSKVQEVLKKIRDEKIKNKVTRIEICK
jgi:ATP-independent RNA helicase DbpA